MMEGNKFLFHKACQIGECLSTTNTRWNSSSMQLTVAKKSGHFTRNKILYQVIFAALVIGGINAFLQNSNGRYPFLHKMLFVGAVFFLLTFDILVHALSKSAHQMCSLVNGLIVFEHKLYECIKQLPIANDAGVIAINLYFAYASLLGIVSVPFVFVYGIHWSDPCKPSLVGYFMLLECQLGSASLATRHWFWGFVGVFQKVALLCLNHYFWAFGINALAMTFTNAMILCTVSFVRSIIR